MNLALVLVDTLALGTVALALHAVRQRFGLAPLLIYLAGLAMLLQALGAISITVDLPMGGRLILTDVVIVPVIYMVLLVLYDADGTAPAQIALGGLIAVGTLALAVNVLWAVHARLPGGGVLAGSAALEAHNWRFTASSIAAFTAGSIACVVCYQALRVRVPGLPAWAAACLAFLVPGVVDPLVFRTLAIGFDGVGPALGAVLTEEAAAVALSPLLAVYLAVWAPRSRRYVGAAGRGATAFLFGTYSSQEAALRRTDLALTEMRSRLQATFENAVTGIAHLDDRGRVSMANAALGEFLGVSADALEGRSLISFHWPESEPGRVDALFRDLQGVRRFRRSDGEAVWGSVRVSTVKPRPEAEYAIVFIEDVTRRRALEERMRRAKQAESISRLTGAVAHHFNSILTVIIGTLGLELEQRENGTGRDADGSRDLRAALDAALQGVALTEQLLTYAGRTTREKALVRPHKVLKSVEEYARARSGEGVTVTVSAEADPPFLVDSILLDAALRCLVDNALEAMPAGGSLRIRAFKEEVLNLSTGADAPLPGEYLVLEVADTGRGMTPPSLDKAAEPFFTTKPPGMRSGLGLSRVHGFAAGARGHLTLSSEEGQGTAVRLWLPVSDG